jgi:hypothetical protein
MKSPAAPALLSAIILALCAIPANAQPYNRTWVSGLGSDANPCTITAPCATFQAALTKTAVGGEVDCLTPGDFANNATVQISQSVSIVCDGHSNGGVLNTSATAIWITAPSGSVVYLSGLDLGGAKNGEGVYVASGSTVYIIHCTIRASTGAGVDVASSSNPTRVIIKDSTIVNNGVGVFVENTASATNAALIANTLIDGNGNFSATAGGRNNFLALTQTLLTGSPHGLTLQDNATADLIGPSNTIAGAISGSPTSVPFK